MVLSARERPRPDRRWIRALRVAALAAGVALTSAALPAAAVSPAGAGDSAPGRSAGASAATGAGTATAGQGAGASRPAAAPVTGSAGSERSAAGVQDFRFASLHVDYTLARNDDGAGVATVVETFVAEFPEADQNHGMQRRIPEDNDGAPLNPQLESVTDGDGDPRPVETDSDDGYLIVTSAEEDYVHGRQTYVFSYTVENVTRHFDDNDRDEFYWDVNGEEWAQPFGEISTTVTVAPELAAAHTGDAACGFGTPSDTRPCSIESSRDGDGLVFAAEASRLEPFEAMTIAIGFESGTFTPFDASWTASPWGMVQGGAFLVTLVAAVWALINRRRLRDEPGRPTIIAEYDPPAGVDALRVAVFLRKQAKAIPAEVLEQAIAGSVRILERPRRSGKKTKFVAELVDPSRADANGRALLEGLFGKELRPGTVFEFGRTNSRLTRTAQRILKDTGREVRDWRRKVPGSVIGWPLSLGIGGGVATLVFGIVALVTYVSPLVPVVLLIAAVGLTILVVILMSKVPLNARGAEIRDHLRGLQQFIEWAEADRIRVLQSPAGAARRRIDTNDPHQMLVLYESLLPYAVVFGQEKRWSEQLAVYYGDRSPGWYHGTGPFHAGAFAAGMSSLSSSATSSSSSSGGSTGGVSAGGGAGGGGGGGV